MKSKKLTLAVRTQIVEDLDNGVFGSGELPSIVSLAKKYDVSVQPVFQALHMLRDENKIIQRQNGRFAKAGQDLSPDLTHREPTSSNIFLYLKVNYAGDQPEGELAEFEIRLFNYLTEYAEKKNYQAIYRIIKQTEEMPEVLKMGDCSAVLIIRKISKRLAELLFALEIPVINFDFESSMILPNNLSINTDNYQAGIYIANEFVGKGCKSFLYIHAGTPKEPEAPARGEGFIDGLKDAGIKDAEDVAIFQFPNKNVKKLISTVKKGKPTGIFAANDYLANIAYLKLLKAGFKINKDFIICGFDDLSFSRENDISTFSVNMEEIVKIATDAVYDMKSGKSLRYSRLYIPARYIARGSTSGNFL